MIAIQLSLGVAYFLMMKESHSTRCFGLNWSSSGATNATGNFTQFT
jgi:hypothetical protein